MENVIVGFVVGVLIVLVIGVIVWRKWEPKNLKWKLPWVELDLEPKTSPDMKQVSSQGFRWEKTSNLWWLCSDTYETLRRISMNEPRQLIIDGLWRCHHHASELELSSDVIGELLRLRDSAIDSTDAYIPDHQRTVLLERLRAVFNSIGQVVEQSQEQRIGKVNHPKPPNRPS